MPPIDELSILIPVDISEPEPPHLDVLEVLRPFEVVLLGYFPVPDQSEPAWLKDEFEAEAAARLDGIAAGHGEIEEVLVFTHDREATIDRVADDHGCEAILTAGDTDHLDDILVALRGDANVPRIVSVVANLLRGSDASVTILHAAPEGADPSAGETLLEETVEQLLEAAIDEDRIDWELVTEADPKAAILARQSEYDLVVLGETEPSLRERIIGAFLSGLIDELDPPALIIRDVE